jgi:hypothetical protein
MKGDKMDTSELRNAKIVFEKDGVRFVKELENQEIGGMVYSYKGPGGFVWIATSVKFKSYASDESELIDEILRNVADGVL